MTFPGLVAFATYCGSWMMSKVLMEWLHVPVVHLILGLLMLFLSALSPFTSIAAFPLVGGLAVMGKLRGKALLLSALVTVLSLMGAVLMQLAWDAKITWPGQQ